MKYRIKIVTYNSGRRQYEAQFRGKLGWVSIDCYGATETPIIGFSNYTDSRQWALERIDLHYAGNTKKQVIEFEYINK